MQIKNALLKSMIVAGAVAASSVQSVAQENVLPPVESIGPKTSIRAFLLPDVPQVLHVAAVRRAWRMDPAIRDFREMAENDWDFAAVGGVPGFGALDPDFDAQAMAAQMLTEPTLTVAGQFGRQSISQAARAGFWSGVFPLVR